MFKPIKSLIIAAAALTWVSAEALELPDSVYSFMVEGNVALSSGESTPFWLVNNRRGLSSLKKSNGYVRGGAFRHDNGEGRFGWEAGVDLVVPWGYTSNFEVHQLYGAVRYRSLSLTVGAKEWSNGVVNDELSSGDMLLSTNTRPRPTVMLEMKDYQPVPFTNKWLSARGYFSMGLYTDWSWQRRRAGEYGTWMKGRMLHTKGLFLRGGNPDKFPITVEGGLEMAAQWGGTFHGVYTEGPDKGKPYEVRFGHSFKSMLKAIIPVSGGNSDDPNQTGEITNVLGNHVGQWSLAVNYTPKDSPWKARLYYEHFFDDHSMMFFDYGWRDMLLGAEVTVPKNPVLTTFVYEYINTKDQSGAIYWDHTDDINIQISGADDYYGHTLWTGWQAWGMGQGNPLLISPIYNTPGQRSSYEFKNNRIKGHHFGWAGDPTDEWHYRVLLTYTQSWGSYFFPAKSVRRNFNSLIEASYSPKKLKGWTGKLTIGADGGDLLGRSFGTMLTITKKGWF